MFGLLSNGDDLWFQAIDSGFDFRNSPLVCVEPLVENASHNLVRTISKIIDEIVYLCPDERREVNRALLFRHDQPRVSAIESNLDPSWIRIISNSRSGSSEKAVWLFASGTRG